MNRPHPRATRAYTLIEVLVVVVILGISGLIVVPSLLEGGSMGVQAAARVIVADLLYAQNEAIAQQAPHRVVFTPFVPATGNGNSYTLQDDAGQPLSAPWISNSNGLYVIDFTSDNRFNGVTIVSAAFGAPGAGSNEITFDALGSPDKSGRVVIEFNDQRFNIDVALFTGRVTVTRV